MILPRVSDPVPINLNITIDDFVIKNLATFEVIFEKKSQKFKDRSIIYSFFSRPNLLILTWKALAWS